MDIFSSNPSGQLSCHKVKYKLREILQMEKILICRGADIGVSLSKTLKSETLPGKYAVSVSSGFGTNMVSAG